MGFFLRSQDSSQDSSRDESERFTLLHSESPVTVKSQFGPFVVKQTVLPFVSQLASLTKNATADTEFEHLLPASDVDIGAHIVTTEVRRDRPVLRVLFHSSRASDPKLRKVGGHDDPNKSIFENTLLHCICIPAIYLLKCTDLS